MTLALFLLAKAVAFDQTNRDDETTTVLVHALIIIRIDYRNVLAGALPPRSWKSVVYNRELWCILDTTEKIKSFRLAWSRPRTDQCQNCTHECIPCSNRSLSNFVQIGQHFARTAAEKPVFDSQYSTYMRIFLNFFLGAGCLTGNKLSPFWCWYGPGSGSGKF